MRLAIIGAKGQLGSELAFQGSRHFDVVPFTHEDVCVEDPRSIKKIAVSKPSVIINTAAFHKVEACEKSPVRAFAVNALGPCHLSSLAREQNSLLVHVSTDFVFSGEQDSWSEEDPPCPINVYGASKAAGEMAVRWICPRHLIIRVACLFGGRGETGDLSFVDLVLNKAQKGEALQVSHERRTSPSYVPHHGKRGLHVARAGRGDPRGNKIFNTPSSNGGDRDPPQEPHPQAQETP
ncbi:MAG: NAD(P)-dependent oxidoreductase [Armatimonadetes bacterium]|nr:NAD(P)-dependent oxidoreductase [Armatimonadota bacterium]